MRTKKLSWYIANLANAEARKRTEAGRALFEEGARHAWEVAEAWMNDGELTGIFAVETYGSPGEVHPETTVGIAVNEETWKKIREANGNPSEADVPPEQDAREFELHFEGKAQLDILTARNAEGGGALARFLQRNGPGIQQVEFRVYDVAGATELLRRRFMLTPVYTAPRTGANEARVNFFLVLAPNGKKLLIELFETSHKGASAA